MKSGTDHRREALREIEGCVCKDRQNSYGGAEDNFATIAGFWTIYLHRRGLLPTDRSLESHDVAALSALIKAARMAHNPTHRDSWVDLGGYAVCGAGIIAMAKENADQDLVAEVDKVELTPSQTTVGFLGPTERTERLIRQAEAGGFFKDQMPQ